MLQHIAQDLHWIGYMFQDFANQNEVKRRYAQRAFIHNADETRLHLDAGDIENVVLAAWPAEHQLPAVAAVIEDRIDDLTGRVFLNGIGVNAPVPFAAAF